MYHHKREPSVCRNRVLIHQERLDRAVLDALAEALDEWLLERAVEKAVELALRCRPATAQDRAQLERELAAVEVKIQRYLAAIPKLPELAEEIQGQVRPLKAEQIRLRAALDALKGARREIMTLDRPRLRRELRARLKDLRGVLGGNVAQTRQILRKLLVGRLTCTAFEEEGRRGYRFTGQGSYADVLPASVSTLVVTPAGFEPAISTLKGSRPWPG
jgi:hypothetical protein